MSASRYGFDSMAWFFASLTLDSSRSHEREEPVRPHHIRSLHRRAGLVNVGPQDGWSAARSCGPSRCLPRTKS